MDQATLLRASAIVERAAFVLFPLGLLALSLASRRMPTVEPAPDSPDQPVTAGEAGLMLLALGGALILRLLWWDQGIPGTLYGGEIITARADVALQKGGLWAQWWHLLRTNQPSSWSYDSAVIQPVVVLFQLIFRPAIHGIVRVGAFFGVAAVALAWVAGRAVYARREALGRRGGGPRRHGGDRSRRKPQGSALAQLSRLRGQPGREEPHGVRAEQLRAGEAAGTAESPRLLPGQSE